MTGKKMILLLGILLIGLLYGCDNNMMDYGDGKTSIDVENLYGTWQHLRHEELDKKNGTPRTDIVYCGVANSMVFDRDGKGENIISGFESRAYEWKIKGDQLTIELDNGQNVYSITRSTATDLYLEKERDGVWYRDAYRKE